MFSKTGGRGGLRPRAMTDDTQCDLANGVRGEHFICRQAGRGDLPQCVRPSSRAIFCSRAFEFFKGAVVKMAFAVYVHRILLIFVND